MRLILAASCAIVISACTTPFARETTLPAPEQVRQAALGYAREYAALGAVYDWGGQDPLPRTIVVDCSGLVVRCYGYACADFGYRLPFEDTTAAGMQSYCDSVSPETGDLIFMGDGGEVTHIAIYDYNDGAAIHFIDSTDLTGGVSERSYPADSPKFISFGRLRILAP